MKNNKKEKKEVKQIVTMNFSSKAKHVVWNNRRRFGI